MIHSPGVSPSTADHAVEAHVSGARVGIQNPSNQDGGSPGPPRENLSARLPETSAPAVPARRDAAEDAEGPPQVRHKGVTVRPQNPAQWKPEKLGLFLGLSKEDNILYLRCVLTLLPGHMLLLVGGCVALVTARPHASGHSNLLEPR